jgi:hypothetical protein
MKTQKLAVAVIHGIGTQPKEFATAITGELDRRCRKVCGEDIAIEPVYWAPVLGGVEKRLWAKLEKGGKMRWTDVRQFMIDFVADAFAYQITQHDRRAYDGIHARFAKTLKRLSRRAGKDAPLCVIAHSLGTVIASNFIYDLQAPPRKELISPEVGSVMGDTPLERGETLALFYTMGSPLALWSLRYSAFGKPIRVPDRRLKRHYPHLLGQAEWVNFYDADDVVGSPLKSLNSAYGRFVTRDQEINAGGLLTGWNPLSHLNYWTDKDVLDPIADKLISVWKTVNPQAV